MKPTAEQFFEVVVFKGREKFRKRKKVIALLKNNTDAS
jgi:hypothetical protein